MLAERLVPRRPPEKVFVGPSRARHQIIDLEHFLPETSFEEEQARQSSPTVQRIVLDTTMSRCQAVARPLARQLRQSCAIRPFTTGAPRAAEVQEQAAAASKEPSALDLDPDTVLPEFEAQLIKAGKMPIGSRRRRVAMRTTQDIPFEQLPYQAFQEARKILAADRDDKLAKIKAELEKIARLEKKDAADVNGGQKMKDTKLASLRREVERLKLLADANDPLVKKRFEDGLGEFQRSDVW